MTGGTAVYHQTLFVHICTYACKHIKHPGPLSICPGQTLTPNDLLQSDILTLTEPRAQMTVALLRDRWRGRRGRQYGKVNGVSFGNRIVQAIDTLEENELVRKITDAESEYNLAWSLSKSIYMKVPSTEHTEKAQAYRRLLGVSIENFP